MLTIAYLANQFPSPVEPYVNEEIRELRKRGARVVAGSVREPAQGRHDGRVVPEIVLLPLSWAVMVRAVGLCVARFGRVRALIARVALRGGEGPVQRLKALAHTFLGACYAAMLEGRGIEHIHVHHGYYGSWIGMTAARLLGVNFSLTLHGSDVLLHPAYLDAKLANCAFCLTVSEYNRRHIVKRYPEAAEKVLVARLGVEVGENMALPELRPGNRPAPLILLAVGRLHAVKDHAFLVRGCEHLAALDVPFECVIAGEGPERRRLEVLIRDRKLDAHITLRGHVEREQITSLYERADVVLLTSRSEGVPLVLMEAMARGKIVLAPAITGIPELVLSGKTGFLYQPGSMDDFVESLLFLDSLMRGASSANGRNSQVGSRARQLDWIRHAAHVQILHNFNRNTNLERFADLFLGRVAPRSESLPNESLVLQQI